MTLLLFLLVLRLPIRIEPPQFSELAPLAPASGLRVSWSGHQTDESTAQAALLMDPTPLFMPTAFSVANRRQTSNRIGDKFPALTSPDDLKFRAGDLKLDQLPPPVAMPAGPAEALAANPPGNLGLGFGRSDQPEVPLPVRQAWVQVSAAGTGQIVLRAALPAGAVPDLLGSNWQPVTFSATVNAAGLVGSVIAMPAPPAQGGFLTLDADTAEQLANYLETKMFLGQRLAPGFYRISIAP